MQAVDEAMLHILSMDPEAYVSFSDAIHEWYVHADLDKGGDGFLSSIPFRHGSTPEDAVLAYFNSCTEIQPTKEEPFAVIVKGYGDERKHYRWNRVCFAEVKQVARV